ncbi:MAG: two-component sensor histidine kinase, partial [Gammaproteobacteria bacterium]|nr:two-component sensor histidine kinase [Gemmatimonadota bacterium]NIU78772.1 two-component sensor histidine kinase [Gammaproteobacteria bacterium]
RALIGETVEAFEPLARQRDARIVQRVEEPFVVTADRGVLSQMLLNLLD